MIIDCLEFGVGSLEWIRLRLFLATDYTDFHRYDDFGLGFGVGDWEGRKQLAHNYTDFYFLVGKIFICG